MEQLTAEQAREITKAKKDAFPQEILDNVLFFIKSKAESGGSTIEVPFDNDINIEQLIASVKLLGYNTEIRKPGVLTISW